MKQAISSRDAPKAIGPYSPAIRSGQLLFVSGQIALDPATGQMIAGDTATETRRVMDNLGALLRAAGLSFADVIRTTISCGSRFRGVNEYGIWLHRRRARHARRAGGGGSQGRPVEIDAISGMRTGGQ